MSQLLLYGLDTIECAYYLHPSANCALNFEQLAVEKEALRLAKRHDPKTIMLGGWDFLLQPYGSSSGFPFVIANQDYTIAFGALL